MRVLLDENLDYELKFLLAAHDVAHVDDMGWKGLGNGALLDAAEAESFEVIVTGDKRMEHQQNLGKRSLALAVLDVHPRTIANLAACVPRLLEQLPLMKPGEVSVIRMPER